MIYFLNHYTYLRNVLWNENGLKMFLFVDIHMYYLRCTTDIQPITDFSPLLELLLTQLPCSVVWFHVRQPPATRTHTHTHTHARAQAHTRAVRISTRKFVEHEIFVTYEVMCPGLGSGRGSQTWSHGFRNHQIWCSTTSSCTVCQKCMYRYTG
jgi:hypothetical protein